MKVIIPLLSINEIDPNLFQIPTYRPLSENINSLLVRTYSVTSEDT